MITEVTTTADQPRKTVPAGKPVVRTAASKTRFVITDPITIATGRDAEIVSRPASFNGISPAATTTAAPPNRRTAPQGSTLTPPIHNIENRKAVRIPAGIASETKVQPMRFGASVVVVIDAFIGVRGNGLEGAIENANLSKG